MKCKAGLTERISLSLVRARLYHRAMPSAPPNLIGTYAQPAVRKGERVTCLYRDTDCVVTGFSSGPISWPRVQPVEHRGGSGLWVCAELERAVRTESALALRHWFGVSALVAWKWRKLFGVNGHTKTRGSRKLQKATSKKGAAAMQAREWTPAERRARSRRSKRLKLKPPGTGRAWTAAETALLGTDRDEVIAERIGRTLGAVTARRQLRCVPAHAPTPVPRREPAPPSIVVPKWTEAQEALLGTDRDAVIAKRIGRTVQAVAVRRRLLGVRRFGSAAPWTSAELKLLGTDADAVIAARLGRSRGAVATCRIARGTPSAVQPRWTDAEEALLGTDADAVIAAQLGRTAQAVRTHRQQRGVRALGAARPWTPEELALLGTASDAALAGQIDRTANALRSRRHSLGVRDPVATRSWTPAELALLGTATDAAVAAQIGRTRGAVQQKRVTLGMAVFAPTKSPRHR